MITVAFGDKYPVTYTANMDLTGATVELTAQMGTTTRTLAQTITNPTGGVVTHVLDGTLGRGSWNITLKVTSGPNVISFPTGTTELLVVE